MKKEQALNILETFLTDEQLERLIRVSDMTGAPISTLIRIAVADYLKNYPRAFTSSYLIDQWSWNPHARSQLVRKRYRIPHANAVDF